MKKAKCPKKSDDVSKAYQKGWSEGYQRGHEAGVAEARRTVGLHLYELLEPFLPRDAGDYVG